MPEKGGAQTTNYTNEAARSLHALLLLAQDRAEGAWYFQQSNSHILASFRAFFWCLPAELFKWSLIWQQHHLDEKYAGIARADFLLASSLLSLSVWIIFAASIYVIMMVVGREKTAAPVIIGTNWFNLIGVYIFFIPASLQFIFPIDIETGWLIELVTLGLVLGLYFRVMKHLLGGSRIFAFALTAANISIGVFLTQVTYDIIFT